MSSPPSAPAGGYDVAVVGGGVIGLCSAWKIASEGMRVAVVDPDPGRGASWVAAGMLAPVSEVHHGEEALLALALASARLWPAFAAELAETVARPIGYRTTGTLVVAADEGDRAWAHELFEFQRHLGLGVEWLTGRRARQLEPNIAPGVRLDDGTTLLAPTVVLAAGSWSAGLEGLPEGAAPAVRPVKGQILRLRPGGGAPVLTPTVRGLVQGSSVYVVPRDDGTVVVGATVEERGFDTAVTAGAVYELLRDAHRVVPGITEMVLDEASAGLRPGSPDNAPIVGPCAVRGAEGLVLATGHYRQGILLAPITAAAVAALVSGREPPEEMRAFGPERFVATAASAGT